VTRGSNGIGKTVVEPFVADGPRLVMNYSPDSSATSHLMAAIGSGKAIAVQADADKVSEVGRSVKATVDKLGEIDMVIWLHLPLVLCRENFLRAINEADLELHFNVNEKGPMCLSNSKW
jgi:3-oxoacyl-[acyl-carrier protein] reductase